MQHHAHTYRIVSPSRARSKRFRPKIRSPREVVTDSIFLPRGGRSRILQAAFRAPRTALGSALRRSCLRMRRAYLRLPTQLSCERYLRRRRRPSPRPSLRRRLSSSLESASHAPRSAAAANTPLAAAAAAAATMFNFCTRTCLRQQREREREADAQKVMRAFFEGEAARTK